MLGKGHSDELLSTPRDNKPPTKGAPSLPLACVREFNEFHGIPPHPPSDKLSKKKPAGQRRIIFSQGMKLFSPPRKNTEFLPLDDAGKDPLLVKGEQLSERGSSATHRSEQSNTFQIKWNFPIGGARKTPSAPQRVSSILLYSGLEIYSSLVDMSYPPFRPSFSFSFSFSLSRNKIIESIIRYQLRINLACKIWFWNERKTLSRLLTFKK